MPLLNFFGEYDHLVPPTACNQLSGAVGSKDVEDVCLETGHIGIYVSSKFQKLFAPKIVQWLKDRDKEDIAASKTEFKRKTVLVFVDKNFKPKKIPEEILKKLNDGR